MSTLNIDALPIKADIAVQPLPTSKTKDRMQLVG